MLRVGFYPNVTHAQALLGVPTGIFQSQLPAGVEIEPKIFATGPALIEALYAGAVDVGYVGPNPAINGYIHSHGKALRIIAGASSGGAVFVLQPSLRVESASDLAGTTLATPQIGNTQDVALRTWLRENGLQPEGAGGNVRVLPMGNPEILSLFKRGMIDGAWVAEPWGARLEIEAGGKVFIDERVLWQGGQFVTAHVIASSALLREDPELVKAFLRGHVLATRRYQADPRWARSVIAHHLEELTRQEVPETVLSRAFSRVEITWDPVPGSLAEAARSAERLGLLEDADIQNIYAIDPLNQVLEAEGLEPVRLP